MSTELFEFPTREDWKRIHSVSAFKKIYSVLDSLESSEHLTGDFARDLELKGWFYEIRQRVEDTAISYFFMMFYYEKGIPDKRWYSSPGINGASVQYYPDFEEVHFHIKRWFDFFSDTLYYKLFSAWDLIGHILKVKYDLEIKEREVYFSTAFKKLGDKEKNLRRCLKKVKDSPVYKEALKIRNNITHNYLPNTAHMVVLRHSQSTTIDLKEYKTSEEIVTNVRGTLELFAETLQCIS